MTRRSRKRGNGEGSIWPRKEGRYGHAAYVLTTAGAEASPGLRPLPRGREKEAH
jgi:hypothetical protein